MKKTVYYILVIYFIFSIVPVFASEYMTLSQYLNIHPEQLQISINFSNDVRNEVPEISGIKQDKPIKISFIYPGHQVSDYWRRSVISFKKRMDQLNILYDVQDFFSKPGSDIRTQEKQFKTALASNPDYLVFTLDAKKQKRIIERVITRKKPRLILQNITTPIKKWEGKQPFLYVGFDHESGSRMLANYFIKKTGGKGYYAVLYYTQGYVSRMRGDTFIQYISTNSDLKLTASYYTDGKQEKAKAAALEILKNHPDISFIYSCSTDVALGALDALNEQEIPKGKIMINGWGGGIRELEKIVSKELDVTIMRMNDDNGVAMAEAIKLDIRGLSKSVPVIYSGDFVLIEKGINSPELEQLKKRAFRLSGSVIFQE